MSSLYRRPSRTLENLQAGDIKLSDEVLAEVNKIVETFEIRGDRYHGNDEQAHLWG